MEKGFCYFGQTLMDDHKLVMISIFLDFLKREKDAIFLKTCLENSLGLGRMQ
jgi:hypothetical protein